MGVNLQMPKPTWEARLELVERFAPKLVLFPEDKRLGRPGRRADFDLNPRPPIDERRDHMRPTFST